VWCDVRRRETDRMQTRRTVCFHGLAARPGTGWLLGAQLAD